MKGFFCRLFNLLPGEEKNTLIFTFLAFLWSFATNCGLKYADALFLMNVGAKSLSNVYTLASCGMIMLSGLLLPAVHHMTSSRLFQTVLTVGICFYSFVLMATFGNITPDSHWLWYAMRVFGYLFFCVCMTSYWTFVDQYHSISGAKRHFCLFSSAIFLGISSSGILMRSGTLALPQVISFILFLLTGIFALVRYISKNITPFQAVAQTDEPEESFSFIETIKAISKSRFTMLMMTGNLLTFLLWVTAEYNYMGDFEAYFAGEKAATIDAALSADFTRFLGGCLTVVGICNVLFGLFLYSRMIQHFGIGSLMVLCPLLFLTTFTGWQFSSSLIFPVLGFFVVEGSLSVIDDNNFNLMLKAVPTRLKYKIRVITETFIEPTAMLLSGLMLSIPNLNSKLLGLILSFFSVAVAFSLIKLYLKTTRIRLKEDRLLLTQPVVGWFGTTWRYKPCPDQHLLTILQTDQDLMKRLETEGLNHLEEETVLQKLLVKADSLSCPAKAKFVSLIEQSCYANDHLLSHHFQDWHSNTSDPDLKSILYLYLAKNDQVDSRMES